VTIVVSSEDCPTTTRKYYSTVKKTFEPPVERCGLFFVKYAIRNVRT